jgi:hypothetical protein
MNSYTGFIMFLIGILFGGALVGFGTFVMNSNIPRKYLKCETGDRKTQIGIMIDDSARLFTLEGEVIANDKITNFTEYLILAEWSHARGITTVNLDRLSGSLEIVERNKRGLEQSAQKFTCNHVNQRF